MSGRYLVGSFREYEFAHGVPKAQVYSTTMYVLAGLLVLGFICNALIRPVDHKYVMTPAQIARTRRGAARGRSRRPAGSRAGDGRASPAWAITAAWLAVGIPIAWGVWVTLQQAVKLFTAA